MSKLKKKLRGQKTNDTKIMSFFQLHPGDVTHQCSGPYWFKCRSDNSNRLQ
jgi:hypothetical protein